MSEQAAIRFVEYGKRFLSDGSTDYMVLDYSDESMKQSTEFLRRQMFQLADDSNFFTKMGAVSAAVVGLENGYLFVQLQNRRENELAGPNARMGRNFTQLRFSILSERQIFACHGQLISPALLIDNRNSESPHAWQRFALNDYTGNKKAVESGAREIPVFPIEYYLSNYFSGSFDKNQFSLESGNLIATVYAILSTGKPLALTITSPYANTLNGPDKLIYQLLLIQNLQSSLGWYFPNQVFTFSLDVVTTRSVNILFANINQAINIAQKRNSNKTILDIFEKHKTEDLYSALIQKLIGHPAISPIQDTVDVYDLLMRRSNLSEEHKLSLIEKHADSLVQKTSINESGTPLLYDALEQMSSGKRTEWIHRHPEKHKVLLAYLVARERNLEFFQLYTSLSQESRTKEIELFIKVVGRYPNFAELWKDFERAGYEIVGHSNAVEILFASMLNHNRFLQIGGKSPVHIVLEWLSGNPQKKATPFIDLFGNFLAQDEFFQTIRSELAKNFSGIDLLHLGMQISQLLPETTQALDKKTLDIFLICIQKIPVHELTPEMLSAWQTLIERLEILFKKSFFAIAKRNDVWEPLHDIARLAVSSGNEQYIEFWFTRLLNLINIGDLNLFVEKYKLLSDEYLQNGKKPFSPDLKFLLSKGREGQNTSLSKIFSKSEDILSVFLKLWLEDNDAVWRIDDITVLMQKYIREQIKNDDNKISALFERLADENINISQLPAKESALLLIKAQNEWDKKEAFQKVFGHFCAYIHDELFIIKAAKLGIMHPRHYHLMLKHWQKTVSNKSLKEYTKDCLSMYDNALPNQVPDPKIMTLYYKYYLDKDNPVSLKELSDVITRVKIHPIFNLLQWIRQVFTKFSR